MEYPEKWNQLPKRERKQKIRKLKREKEKQKATINKVRNGILVFVAVVVSVVGLRLITQKTPEEIAFEQEIEEVSLEGRVEEFGIEGVNHVGPGESVSYKTNPPTSGPHWVNPADWRFNDKKFPDEQLVHNIEHGGIWITYKDLDEENVNKLKNMAKNNSNSVVITKREENSDSVVVASWGRMMKLSEVNETLIQKYIDTYINQSPEKLAR